MGKQSKWRFNVAVNSKTYVGLHIKYPIFLLCFPRQIFIKFPNIKFHGNPSSGRGADTRGRTDWHDGGKSAPKNRLASLTVCRCRCLPLLQSDRYEAGVCSTNIRILKVKQLHRASAAAFCRTLRRQPKWPAGSKRTLPCFPSALEHMLSCYPDTSAVQKAF
jgi:hypothetical protein